MYDQLIRDISESTDKENTKLRDAISWDWLKKGGPEEGH